MDRNRRLLLEIVISFTVGLLILGVMAVATRSPEGNSTGFPFVWSTPVNSCPAPNPFNGCGFTYSISVIGLDYAIWVAIIFALVIVVGRFWRRASKVAAP